MNRGHRIILLVLLVLCSTGRVLHGAAEEPEQLAPADTTFFIRIDRLAELRREMGGDPMFEFIMPPLPTQRHPDAWAKVQKRMDMSGDEIMDRYFGRSVGLIGGRSGRRGAGAIISRVSEEDARVAVERLQLKAVDRIGGFRLFRTGDDVGRVAFGHGWMVLGSAENADYLRGVLRGADEGSSLAENEVFQAATEALPAERSVLVFASGSRRHDHHDRRDGRDHHDDQERGDRRGRHKRDWDRDRDRDERWDRRHDGEEHHDKDRRDDDDRHGRHEWHGRHAVALVREGERLVLHMSGRSPHLGKLLRKAVPDAEFSYGPLPAETLAAVVLKLRYKDLKPRMLGKMNRLLAREVLEEKVLPHLAPPAVLFLGRAPGRGADGAADTPGPAFGVAVRLSDPDAAGELDRTISGAVRLAELTDQRRGGEPAEVRSAVYADHRYHVADMGAAFERKEKPRDKGMSRMVYGRIGSWYVMCNDEGFFRRCIDTRTDPKSRLDRLDLYERFPGDEAGKTVAAGWVRGPETAELLHEWFGSLRRDGEGPREHDEHERHRGPSWPRFLSHMADTLEHYQLVTLRMNQSGEEQARTTLEFLRR